MFHLIIEDAKRALRSRVAELNTRSTKFAVRRRSKPPKESKIACHDWIVEFLPDSEVPPGDVEIHSELNETVQPGYRGTKTTLMEREPSASAQRTTSQRQEARRPADPVFAEIRYEDESGPQLYLMTQN